MGLSFNALPGMDLGVDGLRKLFDDIKGLTQRNRALRMRLLISRKEAADAIDDVLLVQSCNVVERLNDGIHGSITCLSLRDDLPLQRFKGVPVELQIATDSGQPRLIRALIDKVVKGASDGGLTVYQVHVVDPLNFLIGRQRDLYMKNDATLMDVCDELLRKLQSDSAAYGSLFTWTWKLERAQYPVRAFWLQKNESVTQFLFRQWKRYGISWCFRPSTQDDRIEILLFDNPSQLDENPAGEIRIHHRNNASEDRDAILQFSEAKQITAASLERMCADYKPATLMEASSLAAADASDWSQQIGSALVDAAVDAPHMGDDAAEFQRLTNIRMDRHDFESAYALGVSSAPALMIGAYTAIEGLPGLEYAPAEQRRYDFTYLCHQSESNIREIADRIHALLRTCEKLRGWEPVPRLDWGGNGNDPQDRHRYLAAFIAVKHGTPMPPLWSPDEDLPPAHSLSAVVAGNEGEFVNIDELGRVQVIIQGERTKRMTARIRVSTFYAHDEAGALFPLPAGTEVRICFENGDEGKPYIDLSVFNGRNRPPRFRDGGPLPGNKYLAGIHLQEPGTRRFGELVWDLTPNQINVQFGSQHGDSRLLLGSLYGKRFNGEGKPLGEGFLLHTVESGALHTGKSLLLQAEERPQGIGRQLESPKHQDRLAEGLKLQQSLGQYAGEHQGLPTDDQPQGELLDDIKAAPGGSNTDPEGQGGKPTVSVNGEAGIAVSTGKTIVHSAGVNIDTVAGMNLQLLSGRRTVLNAGKGLSMFAHADGIRCIAHHGPVIVQSQHDKTQVEAATDLTLTAIDGKLVAMAGKEIVLCLASGTFLRLSDDGIQMGSNGALHVNTNGHNWGGPSTMPANMPSFSEGDLGRKPRLLRPTDGKPVAGMQLQVQREEGGDLDGKTDASGTGAKLVAKGLERLKAFFYVPRRGGGASASSSAGASAPAAQAYDLHFLVQDEKTQKPLPNVPYRITLENGKQVTGTTDDKGLTELVSADSPVLAKLEAPYYGDDTSTAHTHDEHSACGC